MRASDVTAIAALLVAGLLAGCIGGQPASPTEGHEAEIVTDPTNTSYNGSSGFHVHDYWDGEEVRTVIESSSSRYYNNLGDEGTSWPVRFVPRAGRFVPQGTAELTVTVNWEDESPRNSYGNMELWIKPASTSETRLVEDELSNGGEVEIPLAYEEADLPHQIVSAWKFIVKIRGSQMTGYNHFDGTISIEAQAHRGLELRPFPPHPDHWGDRTELDLVDETRDFYQIRWPTGGFSGEFDERIRPKEGTIVPFGTDRVEATLEWDADEPADELWLWLRAADTRNYTHLEPEEQEGSSARYEIPVEEAMMDSPYANASLWEFKVSAPYDSELSQVPMFDGEFTLTATVYKR